MSVPPLQSYSPLHNFISSEIASAGHRVQAKQVLPGCTLQASGAPKFAHFVVPGLISTSVYLADGTTGNLRYQGAGDLLEVSILLGVRRFDTFSSVIISGEVLRVPFECIAEAFQRSRRVREFICGIHGVEWLESQRTAICNQQHDLEQRLARYLTSIHSRTGQQRLPLTQECLARELGVQRSSLTIAAGLLRKRQVIDYGRAQIHITDPEALAASACECTNTLRQLHKERLTLLQSLVPVAPTPINGYLVNAV